MAGLPEELQKKLSEGSALTPEEVKQVNEHLEFQKTESQNAFRARDDVKKKLREAEETARQAEEAQRQATMSEQQKLQKLVDDLNVKLKTVEPQAQEWENYKSSRVNELKEKAGEQWQESFASLPVADLEKLVAKLTEPKRVGPGPSPASGVDLPKSWQECLDDSDKMALAEKHPELKAKLKREYQAQKGR